MSKVSIKKLYSIVFKGEQDQKSIDAIESDLVSEPGLIIDDNIIEELTDGCSGPVV